MNDVLSRIREKVRNLKLDEALLFLNHVLSVSRGMSSDPLLGPKIKGSNPPILPHMVHFLSLQILLHANRFGVSSLDWEPFRHLVALCIALEDPIQRDPNWQHANPSGFFERVFQQQLHSQRRNIFQKYGIAIGLFQDVGVVEWPRRIDMKTDVEAELGMSITHFLQMGFLSMALRSGCHRGIRCSGTFTPADLVEAYRQGIDYCVPEVWTPFLERVSCDPHTFRGLANSPNHPDAGPLYEQFRFNPLRRFPIVEVDPGHFVAVDPELVPERVTFGLFYDMFEKRGVGFSDDFGYAFEAFVGQMLASALPCERIWSASAFQQRGFSASKRNVKHCDWAYKGESFTVLIECKSLRPSTRLATFGSDVSVQEIIQRIAGAVEQVSSHSAGINRGEWEPHGLVASPAVGLIVTFGKVYAANGQFIRQRIRDTVLLNGLEVIPFAVVSIEEFDAIVRLVELGHEFDKLIQEISSGDGSFDPINEFRECFEGRVSCELIYNKGKAFIDTVCTKPGVK